MPKWPKLEILFFLGRVVLFYLPAYKHENMKLRVILLLLTCYTPLPRWEHLGGQKKCFILVDAKLHLQKAFEVYSWKSTGKNAGGGSGIVYGQYFWAWNVLWGNLDVTIGKTTPAEVYEWHKIDDDGVDFTGHAISLFTNNNYLQDPKQLVPMIKGIKLYAESLAKYEKSPYIYPLWGLGGLPEGFSR